MLGLNLLILPPLIHGIHINYCLRCLQTGHSIENQAVLTYKQNSVGWADKSLVRRNLRSSTKCITFECKIEILELLDESKIIIDKKYWHKFMVDNSACVLNCNEKEELFQLRHAVQNMQQQMVSLQRQMENVSVNNYHKVYHPVPPIIHQKQNNNKRVNGNGDFIRVHVHQNISGRNDNSKNNVNLNDDGWGRDTNNAKGNSFGENLNTFVVVSEMVNDDVIGLMETNRKLEAEISVSEEMKQ